jgi:hypothetical protein
VDILAPASPLPARQGHANFRGESPKKETDRMRCHTLALLTLASAFALTACDRTPEDVDDEARPAVQEEPPLAAPNTRAPEPQAPASEAAPRTGGNETAAGEGAAVAPAQNEPLRFDMTQDGEAQTAEKFEEWMDAQGVRVAEGAGDESAVGAKAGVAVKTGTAETAANAQADTQQTRR